MLVKCRNPILYFAMELNLKNQLCELVCNVILAALSSIANILPEVNIINPSVTNLYIKSKPDS